MVKDTIVCELHSQSNVSSYSYVKISASPKQPRCGNTNKKKKDITLLLIIKKYTALKGNHWPINSKLID